MNWKQFKESVESQGEIDVYFDLKSRVIIK